MSHHLDSELSRRDNRLDLTDQYVFRGETGTVFVLDVNSSAAGPNAPQGFHLDARYEIKIHTDGSALEDLTYRVTFGPPDQAGEQAVALHLLTGSDAYDDDATGQLLAEGCTNTPVSGSDGLRMSAGRAADPFYVDLSLLGIVNGAVKDGTAVDLSAWRRKTRGTASPARPSSRSCSRSPTSIRNCTPVPTSVSGAPQNSPQTGAAGGKSTALATP